MPPYKNSWLYMEKSIFQCRYTQYVWLIVGTWWTILLWSGSIKGWSAEGSAVLLICSEVFLRLTHQKLDYPETFWCNFRNWGGEIGPIAPPWLRAWSWPTSVAHAGAAEVPWVWITRLGVKLGGQNLSPKDRPWNCFLKCKMHRRLFVGIWTIAASCKGDTDCSRLGPVFKHWHIRTIGVWTKSWIWPVLGQLLRCSCSCYVSK